MIKCLFGKLLKQFFIISLISCFILLGNSFVNGEWIFHDVNEEFTVPNMSNFTLKVLSSSAGILNGGGMSAVKPLIVLQSDRNSTTKYRYIYFWGTDKKLYAYGNDDGVPGSTNSLEYLRFDTFYRFAYTGFVNCTYSNLHNSCGSEGVSSESFYSDTSLKGEMTRFAYYFDNSSNNYTTFCWVYDNLDFSICVKPSGASTTSLTPVAGLSQDPVEFSDTLIGTSPWTSGSSGGGGSAGTSWAGYSGSRLSGRLAVESGFNNQQMIEGYECVGLQPSLCYGGFPLNNIFQPSEQFEDFTGYKAGQGATIFEIYSLYSGSFSTFNGFLDTVLARYRNGQINSFKTEPKALLMLGAQMNTAGFKTSYIADYCDLLLNKNNTNQYQSSVNSINDLRIKACLRNQSNSLRTSSGDYIAFQTSHVGIFGTGEDISFQPDVFFSNLMDKFSSALEKIPINGTLVGIIPGYIIVFLLAFIFIRMISH